MREYVFDAGNETGDTNVFYEFQPKTYQAEPAYERRQRMVDARRSCLAVIDECIFWIVTGLRNGRDVSVRLAKYREYVRMVSEYDVELGR